MGKGNGSLTQHHIIPRSRNGKNINDNIMWVRKKLHDKYHSLFSNKTPEEILDYLVKVFWKGKTEYIEKYLEKSF